MKILLDLPDDTVTKFEGLSKTDKRSRKACMELVLIEYNPNQAYLKEVIANGLNIQNKVSEPPKKAPQIKISQYDAYYNEIMDANSPSQIAAIVKTAKSDPDLNSPQRLKLEQIGIEQSKKIDF